MNEELESGQSSRLSRQLEAIQSLLREENYDTAITLARELIEDYPEAAKLYTAVGDAYASWRMWPEAVEWYHDAVQRGDSSAEDKLSEAQRELNAQVGRGDQPSASQVEQQRTKLWITLASAGALVVIAVVIAALTLFSSPPKMPTSPDEPAPARRSSRGGSAEYAPGRHDVSGPGGMPAPPQTDDLVTTAQPPVCGTERPHPAMPTGVVRSEPRLPEGNSTTGPTVVGPRTSRDIVLANAISSLSWPDGSAMRNSVSVAMDPYTGYAMITFQVPRSLQTGSLYGTVLEQSYSVAAAAVHTDPGIKYLTLRGLLDLTDSDRGSRTIVLYRGNTSRESIAGWLARDRSPSRQQLWKEVFATTWWNPGIPHSGLE